MYDSKLNFLVIEVSTSGLFLFQAKLAGGLTLFFSLKPLTHCPLLVQGWLSGFNRGKSVDLTHGMAIEVDLAHPMVRIYVTVRFWLVKMIYHYRMNLDSLPPPFRPLQHCI